MNCERMETRLIAYLDGKASDADRGEVEAHVKICATCQVRADDYRRVWGLLDEVPPLTPSPSFDARLRTRIAVEPRQPWYAWLVPSPRLAVAAALLVVLSVWVSSVPVETVQLTDMDEIQMRDLQVVKDYEVLANFDVLSELPVASKRTM
jgi:anti-sigma factor RsiW